MKIRKVSMENNLYPYRSTFLKEQALDAWSCFQNKGYPHPKNENWRFSNINNWLLEDGPINKYKKEFSTTQFSKYNIINTYSIYIYNDSVYSPEKLPFGIEIWNMNQIEKNDFDNVVIGSIADYKNNSFIAENMALFQNCYIVNIPENTIIDKPIHFIHDIIGQEDNRVYPRLFINVGACSEVEILQTEIGSDNCQHFINSVDEVVVCENAKLDWTIMQQRNLFSGQVSSCNISLDKNACVNYNTFEFGTGSIRRDINTYFKSTGGNFEFNCLFLPMGKQHMDISTMIHHKNAHCNSKQLIKGVLGERSSGVFRGLAYVYNGAKKTDATQTNHNLLLSSTARMNSIPQLEIYDDDVKCAHGATTGQIDKEAVFYLQSRGINKEAAIELMVKGFVDDVIDKIKFPKFVMIVKNKLIEKMKDILNNGCI
tara:strand:+ start:6991 stop:8271 length:1281 start_codon:yes stop_codon:yes gene_type:complete